MGLRETFHAGALAAMNAAGNVAETCTFHRRDYDLITGQPSGETTIPNLRVILQTFEVTKVDNSAVLKTDRQYLAVARDLGTIEPTEDDWLDFGNGETWTVKRVEPDPAKASFLMQVRK